MQTVSSVGLMVPSYQDAFFGSSASGGPIIIRDKAEPPNVVLAGPASGGNVPPLYRSLVTNDLPLILFSPGVFSDFGACSGGLEGVIRPVTNSTTNTWGATVTGGGANHILMYCNGTNWTVIGK